MYRGTEFRYFRKEIQFAYEHNDADGFKSALFSDELSHQVELTPKASHLSTLVKGNFENTLEQL